VPATSQAQYRFMQGIAHGMKPRSGGPSPAVAKEFVGKTVNYKSLPAKAGPYGRPGKK
jgi:hypothetical protein